VSDLYDTYTLDDFSEGQRVELHPVTDFWVAGARYGRVTLVGRQKVMVKLDKLPGEHAISLGLLKPVKDS
jgi:roadblock/LC7 domain-containing protein